MGPGSVDNEGAMKALVLENKRIRVDEVPRPEPAEGEVLIRVLKAGVCRTDLELAGGYMDFKGIPGHELVGSVEDAPDKEWIGRRVVGEINLSCGRCRFCGRGLTKHCPYRSVLGIANKDGAFAEYLTLPLSNCHIVVDGISDHEAVFAEPLAAALDVMEKIDIDEEDEVCVQGDGKLGLLTALVLNRRFPCVCCIGKHERNLDLLRKQGIKTVFRDESPELKFDVVVEATGREEGLADALERVVPDGRIVLKSTIRGLAGLDISRVVVDEIRLFGSRCGAFPPALRLLEKKSVPVAEMVDAEFPFERGLESLSLAR